MDNKDIDDILQAVNGTNGIENNNSFFNILHHRSPGSSNKQQLKSLEPVNSVSSSDCTPPPKSLVDCINTMDKLSNVKQILGINDTKPIQQTNPDNNSNGCPSGPVANCSSDSNGTQGPSVISLMGYSIPESTLYFILVLLIIGAALYFLTGDSKKDKDNEKNKN